MTEPTDSGGTASGEQVEIGDRDPLSTDDGLAAVAAAGMPEVEDGDLPDDDQAPGALLDNPSLDIAADGTDPCTELGFCAADVAL